MAEATRRRAIYQVQNVLQAYKDKIEYARTYFDNLTKEGQDLVLDYTKENSEIKDLLTNAIKEYAFFYGMDNSDLIEYTKVCKKLNTVFNLNINNVENISKIIDDNFYITSDAQRITSFTEVELGRAVTYNVGDGYGIDANTKQNQTIYDVEWEVEDVDGNFDEATSKREKRLINIVNFANNAATDWPIISLFSEANPFEIQLKATELGEYKIRAKIYKDYGVTKTLCDVIEFNQLVTEVDEKIASLSTWEKLKKALSMVQWKQEIDIDMLVQSLIDSLPIICFMSALILTFGDVAAALLALMSLADGSKDLFDGFVKTAEGFEIVKNAGSNNALKHGGEVIYEGLNIFGLGTIEIFLSKCTMKNVQTAKMQLAKSGAKALSTASKKGLPATVQSGIASSEVATLPAIKEISEIQLSKAMADSAKKSSDLLADVAVSKNEKVLLDELTSTDKLPDYVKLCKQLEKDIINVEYDVLEVVDSVVANAEWNDMGFDLPPIANNTKAFKVKAGNYMYARVFKEGSKSKAKSPFILRYDDIKGLKAEEIAEKYALPQVPDRIVFIKLPEDLPLEVSIVGPQKKWNTLGGSVQYTIKYNLLEDKWFENIQEFK